MAFYFLFFVFVAMTWYALLLISFLLVPLVDCQVTPIRFCRTDSKVGRFSTLDPFLQEGFLFWKEWVDQRGGIMVGNTWRPIQYISYEDAGNDDLQLLLYQRLLTVDQCDFLFSPFASATQGVKIMTMLETGVGAIDSFLAVRQVPYLYRHGASAGVLWQGRNWTWSFSLLASDENRGRPCYSRYGEAGAKTATIIVTPETPGYNASAALAARVIGEYGINATIAYLPHNSSLEQIGNFSMNVSATAPDLLLLRLNSSATQARLLQTIRLMYQPKGIHITNENQLANGTNFFAVAQWASNHTTAAGSWSPTPEFVDSYYGTGVDLSNNLTARFPLSTINEFHASAAISGLLYVIAIEETDSIDPVVIRNFLRTFNRTLSYGPLSWLNAGELSSASWQCIQARDEFGKNVSVLTANTQLIYPAFAVPPPTPPPTRPPGKDKRVRNVLIGVFSAFAGLVIIVVIVAIIIVKKYHLIFIDKGEMNGGEEWNS